MKLPPAGCLSDPMGRKGFLAGDQEEKPLPAWTSEYEVFTAPRVSIHLREPAALGGTVLRAGTRAWFGVSKDQEDETGLVKKWCSDMAGAAGVTLGKTRVHTCCWGCSSQARGLRQVTACAKVLWQEGSPSHQEARGAGRGAIGHFNLTSHEQPLRNFRQDGHMAGSDTGYCLIRSEV